MKNIFSSWRKLIFQKNIFPKKIQNPKSQNFQIADKNQKKSDFQKSLFFSKMSTFLKIWKFSIFVENLKILWFSIFDFFWKNVFLKNQFSPRWKNIFHSVFFKCLGTYFYYTENIFRELTMPSWGQEVRGWNIVARKPCFLSKNHRLSLFEDLGRRSLSLEVGVRFSKNSQK